MNKRKRNKDWIILSVICKTITSLSTGVDEGFDWGKLPLVNQETHNNITREFKLS